ncbi:hypothetical protein M0M57_01215 [Flavobacterium azooxidireducens]|uniref:Uncharacterized protein n=1 Tax=Flavobacterium azooxidireducens TaxID=1871076 RepID=A0ABY4KFA6_9FLAO|nr:hypothetical protein [Flavobacterium azooxidireducens]UPQ79471.1 hypothetical protein M0M57_01215 [Flavobacterium azooxidireducens]
MIGIKTVKPYKQVDHQFIGTQFLIVVFPLIPINSYFIIDDLVERSFEIGINWKHLVKIYSGILTFIIIVLMILPEFLHWSISIKTLIIVTSLSLTLGLIFNFDRMDQDEKEKRLFFGKVVGINALPSYMSMSAALLLRNKFTIALKNQINTSENWKEILDKKLYSDQDIPLIYIIAEYQYRIDPSDENKAVLTNFKQQTTLAKKN